ncbi:MAG: polysaccharide deacetylase family protein [Calditrichaeota bacterium]|nr:polysaccharide deacetylase family protein [Calditrichota bacterium]MCB0267150.1 polysaccharide deacetylase family protein [Calditrichota bacterium]MCB9066483.1 polysaccharide deacetylase family protein [Calditrichia bacterium]
MKYGYKSGLFSALGLTGVYSSYRRINQKKALVLTYHGILPEIPSGGSEYEYRNFVTTRQFDQQIQFLLKNYRPLKAADFCHPDVDTSSGFLITFDDGFRNNYRYAVPILQKYGIEGCFFISTGLIGTRDFLWTEEVTRLLNNTKQKELMLGWADKLVLPLVTTTDRANASQIIRKKLKLAPKAERDEAMACLRSQLSDVPADMLPDEEERYLFMTWDEVKGMVKAGQHIGAHTHTHSMLSTLSESESWEELKLSKELLEKATAQECFTMSYPNGESDNFSELHKTQLKKLGYKCAFSQIPLFNNGQTDRFALHRFNVSLGLPLSLMEAKLCGLLK